MYLISNLVNAHNSSMFLRFMDGLPFGIQAIFLKLRLRFKGERYPREVSLLQVL